MEEKICGVCNTRYSLYKVPSELKENLPICMHCLKGKVESGEIKLKGKQRIEFLEKVSATLRRDDSNNAEQSGLVVIKENQSTQDKPIFALNFGYDLTAKAKEHKVDPLIGREKEVENALRVMKRRYKNNPILVGEPGVGKTAIVEGIAAKISRGEVSDNLKNKKIIALNMGSLIAGTKYRGEFEERMKKIIDEARNRDDIILFLDEFHTIVNTGGGEGSIDAAQMLKPPLSRGEIQVIGTTTLDEYRIHIEKDKALERRFQRVLVNEPTTFESVMIIQGLKQKYEEFHNISIPEETIVEAVELSQRYITDRMLPDKAIDLLDEACAHKVLRGTEIKENLTKFKSKISRIADDKAQAIFEGDFELAKQIVSEENKIKRTLKKKEKEQFEQSVISKEDLAYILNQWTGIPAQKMTQREVEKLRTFESDMEKRVKGQGKAITALSKSIKRSQVGLKDEKRPIGVFMMLGPTGVGKTEMTKALTELLFGDESKMERFDMGEYMEPHSVAKLIGSPPGYVGYEDEGKLTKYIRQNPYSVILFDEMEKAHKDVQNILLQLFDEGRITNSKGRTVDAKNIIFIMTSNAGSDLYSSKKTSLGYNTNEATEEMELEKKIKLRLKDHFTPEFLNRVDDFLVFNKLSKDNMVEIANKFMEEIIQKMIKKGTKLTLTPEVITLLAEKGYDPEMGARPLKRKIEELKTLIADKIIESLELPKEIIITVESGEFILK